MTTVPINNLTVTPQLGLVCITTSDAVRFRALTRTRLQQYPAEEQAGVLRALYADNLSRFEGAIDFCHENGIRLYRVSSALFPHADTEQGAPVLDEFNGELRRVGDKATELGIRVIAHPEQFIVLSSDNPQVIVNSIKTLEYHARLFDIMGFPRSSWATLILHGGKGNRSERLIETVRGLSESVRSRLALENDEDAYGASDILAVCRAAGVPMIFDAHHHVCHEKQETYDNEDVEAMFWAARETWPVPEWQIVHISNGRECFGDTRHSDIVSNMPSVYRYAPWIEVEAKSKEEAIAALKSEWLLTLT